MKKLVFATMAIIVMLALAGCPDGGSSGGGSTSKTPTVTSVTVGGGSTSIAPGGTTAAFTVTVTGEHNPAQTVTWSLVSGEIGDSPLAATVATINQTTHVVTAAQTAPDGTVFRVKATSQVDTTKFGYSNPITVVVGTVSPTITGVTIDPEDVDMERDSTQQFTATVTGTGDFVNTVTWSKIGGVPATTLVDGVLTVAATETPGTVITVTATSTADSTKSASAHVTVVMDQPPLVNTVTVSPGTARVVIGGTQTFTVVVAGNEHLLDSQKGVTWSRTGHDPTKTTAISAAGVLTVAADETAESIKVIATSTYDTSKSGEVTVIIPGCPCCRTVNGPCKEACTDACVCVACIGTCPAVVKSLVVSGYRDYYYQYLDKARNFSNIVVDAVHNKGPNNTLLASEYEITAVDAENFDVAGIKKYKATLKANTAVSREFSVEVIALASLVVNHSKVHKQYYQYIAPASVNIRSLLEVDAVYNHAQHPRIEPLVAEFTLEGDTGINFDAAGNKTISVKFGNITETFNLAVAPLVSITAAGPTRIDESLATTAAVQAAIASGQISITGNYGAELGTHLIPAEQVLPSQFTDITVVKRDSGGTSYADVTFKWRGITGTYTSEITNLPVLSGIVITPKTALPSFYQFITDFDETAVKAAITVTANYTRGKTSEEVTANVTFVTDNFDKDAFGQYVIPVHFENDFGSANASLSITVIKLDKIEVAGIATSYTTAPTPASVYAQASFTAQAVYGTHKENIKPLLVVGDGLTGDVLIQTEAAQTIEIRWKGETGGIIRWVYIVNQGITVGSAVFTDISVNTINIGTLKITASPIAVTLQNATAYTGIQWYLNNAAYGNADSVELNPKNCRIGTNVLSVEAMVGGVKHRINLVFTVEL